jgi:hypothetical protein
VKRRRDEVLTGLPGLGGRGLADSLDGRSLTRTRKRLLVSMRSAGSSIYSVGRDCLVGGSAYGFVCESYAGFLPDCLESSMQFSLLPSSLESRVWDPSRCRST